MVLNYIHLVLVAIYFYLNKNNFIILLDTAIVKHFISIATSSRNSFL